MRVRLLLATLGVLAGTAACAPSTPPATTPERPARGQQGGIVASAHPLATEAGVRILEAGGNAVDAAVAVAFAVGVVEPMMAGIGGGGGMLIWDQAAGRADYLDFYPRAPANPDTTITYYRGRWDTPRGVGVPGAVAGLLEAHERMGRLSLEQVVQPAIELAAEGFPVHGLLARTIADDSAKLTRYRRSQELFWPNYRPLRAGERLVQPELAETMRRVVRYGRAGFHEGPVAEEIVRVVREGGNPITLTDIAGFEPRWLRPVCGVYRGRIVLSAPPPKSGMQIVQALHLLEAVDLPALGLPTRSPEAFHALVGALRISSADRAAYLGDPDHFSIPAAELSSPRFAQSRRQAALERPVPAQIVSGDPWTQGGPPADACTPLDPFPAAGRGSVRVSQSEEGSEGGETTHLSVVDAEGNAVSLTFTQGVYFGTGAWAAGTFLNSALLIFAGNTGPHDRIGPNRAPPSTTTATIVLEDGTVRMVVGSPGGGRIPSAVLQTMVYTLDYGLQPEQAVGMPRVHPFFSTPEVRFEQGIEAPVLEAAAAMGYQMEVFPPLSLHFGGVKVLERRAGQWIGAADPRREGTVRVVGAGATND